MSFKKIFNKVLKPSERGGQIEQVSMAVILFRLVRSDGQAKMLELMHMGELLRKEFNLSQEELESVFALADDQESKQGNPAELVEEVCNDLSSQRRVKLLEYLWILAFSDDKIDKAETMLIEQVAEQLDLSEVEQVTAQENAEKHLGLDSF